LSVAVSLNGRDVATRLSLLYAAIFVIFGVQAPFLAVWLGSRGLDINEIALILAAPRVLQFLALPLLTRWADHRGQIARMLLVSAVLMALIYSALMVADGVVALLVLVGLLFCAQAGAMPLIDVLTFAIYRPHDATRAGVAGEADAAPFDYGGIRKWGSAAFIAGNLLGGLFLSMTSLAAINVALAWTAILAAAAALYAAPLDAWAQPAPPDKFADAAGRGPALLVLVIVAAAIIQASHVLLLNFGAIHWAGEGYSNAFIGAAWAIGVGSETLFFAFIGRWRAANGQAAGLMILGAGVALVRWVAMAFDPGPVVLALAQAGHGFSFAATHIGTMLLISELAPAHMRGRAQGWMIAANSALSAVLIALCGPLYGRFDEHAYFVMAGFALVGLALSVLIGARRAD
jgi:MFS transporter, PPP family, 3-phenylpropionic acid transporter